MMRMAVGGISADESLAISSWAREKMVSITAWVSAPGVTVAISCSRRTDEGSCCDIALFYYRVYRKANFNSGMSEEGEGKLDNG